MPNKSAFVIIDVQQGMFPAEDPVANGEELLAKIGQLITRARDSGTPIIYIQHDDEGDSPLQPDTAGWQIHPAIAPGPDDTVIRKRHPDSFQETELQQELERLQVNHMVVAGIQTDYCIDTTCRRAYSMGFQVTLVEDGHSTWDTEHLQASQIIAHHNEVLSSWFVSLKAADAVQFGAHSP